MCIKQLKMSTENSLFDELRMNTQANVEMRRNRQEIEKRQLDEKMSTTLDRLTEEIENGCVGKMIAASNDGHYYATLLSFTNQDMFDDYKTVFLIKGPFRGKNVYGLLYYEQKGMISVMKRLNDKYSPIEFFTKYDRSTKTHHVLASWKGNEEHT